MADRAKGEEIIIQQNRKKRDIALRCRLYGVSRAGSYAWRQRRPSHRQQQDEPLARRIAAIYAGSKQRYGRPLGLWRSLWKTLEKN